jgi:hypothetical protein
MKKLLFGLSMFVFTTTTQAQVSVTEDNNIKNFRFGLKGELAFDWLNSDNPNKILNNGVGLGYDWGMQLEFRLADNFSFVSGLSLRTASYKINYKDASEADPIMYILDRNSELVERKEDGSFDTLNHRMYLMDTRNFKTNYVTIPLLIKMKTKEIGYLTYFGQFGANLGFATKSRANDSGRQIITDTSSVNYGQFITAYENENINVSKSVVPLRAGLVVGGGAEYNISGSTSLFFSLHYNHNFISYLKANDKYTQRPDLNNPGKFVSGGYKMVPGAIVLTVGVLF